jgi:FAD/FMN-containing dehydrogenase
MSSFLETAGHEISAVDPAAAVYVFGHLGDGNLHYMVRTHRYEPVADLTFACVARMGGAVSAEHGIGLDKKKWLPWVRSTAEMAVMRRLKSAFDPNNILNPGRVFDMLPGHRMEHA